MDLLIVVIACVVSAVIGAVIGAHVGTFHIPRRRNSRRMTATMAQLNGRLCDLEAAIGGYRHHPGPSDPNSIR